jgi:hypothetical protein
VSEMMWARIVAMVAPRLKVDVRIPESIAQN